jgi:hypothetical protein
VSAGNSASRAILLESGTALPKSDAFIKIMDGGISAASIRDLPTKETRPQMYGLDRYSRSIAYNKINNS